MIKKLSFRAWVSIITFGLIALILYASRHELAHAWYLLGQVNIWILLLIFPVSALGYLAAGEMVFSYLRQKGYVSNVRPWSLMRLSLELNFVNHAFPSGGVSGISYANWRLRKYGVPTSRATMAQVVRYATGFAAVAISLFPAVLIVTIDGSVNRWIILMSSSLVLAIVILTMMGIYFLSSPSRLHKAARWLTLAVNNLGRQLFKRKKPLLQEERLVAYFDDVHDDFLELKHDKKLLRIPFFWGLFFTVMEILPLWMTFQSLGVSVNPATILIAYGVATAVGVVAFTPGGAGAYETVMVLVLVVSGVNQGQAIAGTVLYRVLAIMATLVFGYLFYQLTILKYGKQPSTNTQG